MKGAKNSRWKRLGMIVGISLAVGGVLYFLALDLIFSRAVPRAVLLGFAPSQVAQAAVPESQVAGHTCGWHAVRTIYAAHELVPDEHRLRFRMGIDRTAIPGAGSTLGALQADICRVLAQDGFRSAMVDLDADDAVVRVIAHLENSWKGLALIRKPSNGNLHWIVVDQDVGDGASVRLVDSQKTERESIGLRDFLQTQAVTLFLVSPAKDPRRVRIKEAHRLGVRAMRETPERLRHLGGLPQ